MRFLHRLLSFLVAIIIIAFSVMNRHDITLLWAPGEPAIVLPLYIIFFAGIFFGLIAAAYATSWLRLKAFTRARAAERKAGGLESERTALHEEVTALKADERHQTQSEGGNPSTSLVSEGEKS